MTEVPVVIVKSIKHLIVYSSGAIDRPFITDRVEQGMPSAVFAPNRSHIAIFGGLSFVVFGPYPARFRIY